MFMQPNLCYYSCYDGLGWHFGKRRASSIDVDTIRLHWSHLLPKDSVKNGVREQPTAAKKATAGIPAIRSKFDQNTM